MQANRVKRILREGGLALGTYVGGIADPQIVEIIGHAGYDAAFIDMEHTSFDLRDVQLMVMAAERVGITPIVRTPGFDPAFVLRLLDMGVQGIQLPHISDARAAREGAAKATWTCPPPKPSASPIQKNGLKFAPKPTEAPWPVSSAETSMMIEMPSGALR